MLNDTVSHVKDILSNKSKYYNSEKHCLNGVIGCHCLLNDFSDAIIVLNVSFRSTEHQTPNALSELTNITLLPLDLSDINSVRALAAYINANRYVFDYVICNAGIMASPEKRVGPGWESQFATNHIGH
ncbi:hypothetical protein ACR71G_02160 [Xenorhabdus bovienii]|uniref:hypothetical protein n=1 Tax=Xenorhabdus bovienii TaxID=40576 RepID=UPI003DA380D6